MRKEILSLAESPKGDYRAIHHPADSYDGLPYNFLKEIRVMTNRKGFTLVELSIVLVILGLLVGGVLAGQSLIKAAEKRAQIAQHSEIETAILTFKEKYFHLPGDLPNATSFWTASSQPDQVSNGDGDGKIGGVLADIGDNTGWCGGASFSNACESHFMFEHLTMAGLWNGQSFDETDMDLQVSGTAIPEAKFVSSGEFTGTAGTAGVESEAGVRVGYELGKFHIPAGHKIRWGSCTFVHASYSPGHIQFNCGLTPEDAWHFDTKMDDGKPLTGRFHVTSYQYTYRVPGNTTQNDLNNQCLPTGSANEYNLSGTNSDKRNCHPSIKAGF